MRRRNKTQRDKGGSLKVNVGVGSKLEGERAQRKTKTDDDLSPLKVLLLDG
jgi:hypothetical protein